MLFTQAALQDYEDLFNSAKHELDIFTGRHDMEYADAFIRAAGCFLSRQGSRLRLACQCGQEIRQCPIVKAILATPGRQGEILVYDSHNSLDESYFILADRSSYRIEFPEFAETIIDYDDREEAARLLVHFEYILSTSTVTTRLPPPLRLLRPDH